MGEHEDKIEIIRKYASQVKSDYNPFHIKGEIPSKNAFWEWEIRLYFY